MSAILIIAGLAFIVYGFERHAVPFIIGGIVLFVIGMLVANRGRSRRRSDADGGSSDTTTSYESHHDSHGHDSGWGDSGGDSGGGDGGGGGD